MKSSLLASLLILSILIYEAQGIRFKKGFVSAEQNKIHESTLTKKSNGGIGKGILCKEGHCSGNSRKLMIKSTSSTTTSSKLHGSMLHVQNDKNGGNTAHDPTFKGKWSNQRHGGEEEKFSVNSSPVPKQRVAAPERYPDIIDIAGMDYSPAKKKPPIHN